MSFYDAFRGFFGFPGRARPRDPLFGGAPWDDEEEEEDEDGGPPVSRFPQDFGFSPGSSRGPFEELFRDMGELLGAFWAEPRRPFEPSVPGPADGRALRDSMLKQPESPAGSAAPGGSAGTGEPARAWTPFLGLEDAPRAPAGRNEDGDLDSQVSSAGLATILRDDEPESRSFFQSVSVSRVTLPDGAVEERRTVQDGRGRRHTTVTRRGGDQALVSSCQEDGHGKDYRRDVLNVDDRELARFAGTWPQQDELHSAPLSDPSSVLGTFLRRWFSSW